MSLCEEVDSGDSGPSLASVGEKDKDLKVQDSQKKPNFPPHI